MLIFVFNVSRLSVDSSCALLPLISSFLLSCSIFRVLFAIVMGGTAVGRNSSFGVDYTKAMEAAGRLFAIIDKKPRIEVDQKGGKQLVSLQPPTCTAACCCINGLYATFLNKSAQVYLNCGVWFSAEWYYSLGKVHMHSACSEISSVLPLKQVNCYSD